MKTTPRSHWPAAFCLLTVLLVVPNALAQLPNAWQITDSSSAANSTLGYTNQLSASHLAAATNDGFRLTVNARFVTDLGTRTMNMSYSLGNRRYLVWWDLDSNGDLTAELEGGLTYTLTTNGTGSSFYHAHEIMYDPASATAMYLMDGQIVATNWQSSANPLAVAGRVRWGAGSEAGKGRINYHSVAFAITGLGSVANYDAGTTGNPPLAPNPVALGWTLDQGPGTAVTNISPDNVLLPASPAVATLAATGVEPHQATLAGRINSGGLAATVWFDWGTTTNFGNSTLPRFLPADTNDVNLSQTITGLAKGTDYHFRFTANTASGVIYGADTVFSAPPVFAVTSLKNSGPGSLRQSIAHALSGDTITFATNGTIVITGGVMLIPNDLNIAGPGSTNVTLMMPSPSGANDFDTGFEIASNVTASISGITFANCRRASLIENFGACIISNTTFFQCVAPFGDIVRNDEGTLTINGSLLSENFGSLSIIDSSRGSVTISNSVLSDNRASNFGGAIRDGVGEVTINNSVLSGNSADWGGAISLFSGTVAINNSVLSGNSAQSEGGAIYNDGGALTLNSSMIASNSAREGGGIYNRLQGLYPGTANINACAFSGNSATSGNGGGIWNDVTLTVDNSTFFANSTATNGGGIYSAGPLTINNSTFTGNSAGAYGGGLLIETNEFGSLVNTIVAGNLAGGTFASPDIIGGYFGIYNVIGGDPRLAPLGNYGGPTPTQPPLPGSPAINGGSGVINSSRTTDQRGYPRLSGARVDIGAVEVQQGWVNNPPRLTDPLKQTNGALTFSFTNIPNVDFFVLGSTNVALPLSQWSVLGLASPGVPGQYQFTDPSATNYPARFYRLVSP